MSEPRANHLSMLAGIVNVSMMWLINGEGEGVEGPILDGTDSNKLADILTEFRVLRTEMHKKAEQLGRLEKRIRTMFEGTDSV